jgi:hypothetical protein
MGQWEHEWDLLFKTINALAVMLPNWRMWRLIALKSSRYQEITPKSAKDSFATTLLRAY